MADLKKFLKSATIFLHKSSLISLLPCRHSTTASKLLGLRNLDCFCSSFLAMEIFSLNMGLNLPLRTKIISQAAMNILSKFLLNGICLPDEAKSEKIIKGKPLSEWNVGANFFESFALNHHGYLNVGYMVICLSNIAMIHFAYKKRGLKAPEELYHNAYGLWQLIKKGRFYKPYDTYRMETQRYHNRKPPF